ncbi:MAG: nitronate monooxygenase [Bacteroidota bacterium]
MKLSNAFTEHLQIKYPIIQAPMLGVSTPEMAAAISNEGGLGSLAVGGLSPDATRTLIGKTKSLTNKPFAVNLFVHELPSYNDSDLEPMRQFLIQLANKKGYQLNASDLSNFTLYTYRDQVEILIDEKVNIISFTFGCLDQSAIKKFKENNCILIGTVTCLQEALILQEQQIDMITAQGIEAGGHRGTFLDNIPLPHVGLFSLLSQLNQKIKLPYIAAGGINSGRGIKAALDLGAVAVQIGTAFIGTNESEAILSYKQKLERAVDTDSALTRAFSGRWARGLRNQLMNDIENANIPIPPYPLQNSLTGKFRKLAQQNNDADYTNLWAGQSSGSQKSKLTKEVFLELIQHIG